VPKNTQGGYVFVTRRCIIALENEALRSWSWTPQSEGSETALGFGHPEAVFYFLPIEQPEALRKGKSAECIRNVLTATSALQLLRTRQQTKSLVNCLQVRRDQIRIPPRHLQRGMPQDLLKMEHGPAAP